MTLVEALSIGNVPNDWLDRLGAFSKGRDGSAILVNAKVVEGMVHIESAVEHAVRAFSGGTNRSRDTEVESILYLTGERRIDRALDLAAPGERNVLIVVGGGIAEAAGVLGVTGEALPRICEGSFEALERTAMLDLDK